jgi:uncharacterized membrane protein (DUF4010 family)
MIQVVSTLSQRYLGKGAFLGVSFLGGLVSSASTAAASANLAGHEQIQSSVAGVGVVLGSIASALVNLPVVFRSLQRTPTFKSLSIVTIAMVVIGVVALIIESSVLRNL